MAGTTGQYFGKNCLFLKKNARLLKKNWHLK